MHAGVADGATAGGAAAASGLDDRDARKDTPSLMVTAPSNEQEDNERAAAAVAEADLAAGDGYRDRKLHELETRIDKAQARIDVVREKLANYFHPPPDLEEELADLCAGLDAMRLEKRHFEHHVEMTDNWWSTVGQWSAKIQLADYHEDESLGKKLPLYVILVHRTNDADTDTIGWVVARPLSAFELLRKKLKVSANGPRPSVRARASDSLSLPLSLALASRCVARAYAPSLSLSLSVLPLPILLRVGLVSFR